MKNGRALYYEAEVEWTEREGNLQCADFPLIQIPTPPKFQGRDGVSTPEYLYVASVNSCFMSAFMAFARDSKLEVVSFSSTALGKLEKIDDHFQMTEIVLKPRVVVRSNDELERASAVLEKAKRGCLISKSIKTAIKLKPEIYTARLPCYPCPAVSDSGCRIDD